LGVVQVNNKQFLVPLVPLLDKLRDSDDFDELVRAPPISASRHASTMLLL
jgi:hypothetical protein